MRFTFKTAVVATAIAVVSSATLFAQNSSPPSMPKSLAVIADKTNADIAKIIATTPSAQLAAAVASYIMREGANLDGAKQGTLINTAMDAVPASARAGIVSNAIGQIGGPTEFASIKGQGTLSALVSYAVNASFNESAVDKAAIASAAVQAVIAATAGNSSVTGGALAGVISSVANTTQPSQMSGVVGAMIEAAAGKLDSVTSAEFISGVSGLSLSKVSGTDAAAVKAALIAAAPAQTDMINRLASDAAAQRADAIAASVKTNGGTTPSSTSPTAGTDPTAGLPPTASGGTSSSTGADPTAGLPATASGGTTDAGNIPATPGTNFGGASSPTNSGGGGGAVSRS